MTIATIAVAVVLLLAAGLPTAVAAWRERRGR